MTRAQQIAECLVDGTSVNVARRPALQDVDLDAAITDEILWLRAVGEPRWAKRIEHANHEPDRCFKVGHYLFWLHRDAAVAAELTAVDELLYAVGYRLPALGPRPPGPSLIYGWPI